MVKTTFKIALDGPSGSGKSTLAKNLAKRYGFVYIDTGALYRTIGLFVCERGIASDDKAGIISCLPDIKIEMKLENGGGAVDLGGKRIGDEIRTPVISKYASDVSKIPEVRAFLVETFTHAVRDWGFDGLKLDFIDRFVLKGKSLEFDARRDYHSLEDAVDALMIETSEALRKINPEVLIEFRQTYVGPAIRKYGNMLRVGDCPNDAILNRQGIVNLRLTSGNTAVHSDMVMWNREDTVEGAAVQLANILYSVPQISVKLDGLPEDHKKMLAFYLSFWRENRDVLIEGKLLAANPESVYSQVCSQKDGKAIFTVYTDGIVDCAPYSKVIVVNSSRHSALILKGADQKSYRVLDCMGNEVEKGSVQGSLCEIEVPFCGMVEVE